MQATASASRSTATAANNELNLQKRRNGWVSALDHLAMFTSPEDKVALESRREIVKYLVRTHMLALQLFRCEEDHYTKRSAAGDLFVQSLSNKERDMAKKLDKEREDFKDEFLWKKDGTYAPPGTFDVPVPMQNVRDLALEDINSILLNSKPNAYYSHFLVAQKRLFEISKKSVVDFSDQTDNLERSYRYGQETIGIKDLFNIRREANDNMEQLVCVLQTLQLLRECIGRAAESSHLTKGELQSLKIKLAAFDKDSQYSNATQLVFYSMGYQPCLVNVRSDRWCDYDATKPRNSPMAPLNMTATLPQIDSIRSTLAFIVPTVSLISIVPAAIAWKYGDSVSGSTADSNFWQAVSGSVLQLLGLITFVWPTLSNPRLSQLAWVWIWMLAGFSAICAVLSTPVYLVAPTVWSFGISFAGMLAQAVVQLQVINAI